MDIDQMLADARARLTRLSPEKAARALAQGAVMVDIRTFEQRREHGVVPEALVVSRNVLEWRVDPTSPYHDPAVAARRGPLIVMCQEGYSSSLAAATLQQLNVADATDLEGGFEAWAAAGLPVESRPIDDSAF